MKKAILICLALCAALPSLAWGQDQSFSSVSISISGPQGHLQFTETNGKFQGTFNGNAISKEQLKQGPEGYTVLNEKGEPIATFKLHFSSGYNQQSRNYNAWKGRRLPSEQEWEDAVKQYGNRWNQQDAMEAYQQALDYTDKRPKVRIGISMGDVDPALASQLGVDPRQSVLVTEVSKGLPAEKAGLKKFDVIVEVEGVRPATKEGLLDALREKKPGDELKIVTLRQGEERRIMIPVAEYSDVRNIPLAESFDPWGYNQLPEIPNLQHLFKYKPMEYENMKDMFKQMQPFVAPEYQDQWHQKMEETLKQVQPLVDPQVMENLQKYYDDLSQYRFFRGEDNDQKFWFNPLHRGQYYTSPNNLRGFDYTETIEKMEKDVEKRLQALEDRLANMEHLLQRLADRLDR